MVPEGSFHIRLLEFKVKNYAILKFTILIYQRFPGRVMNIRSLLGHGYLWNVTGMEMGSTQREQKWPQARTGWGFQSWDSAGDHHPPPGTFMYTFSSCFQLETCFSLTSENDFHFSSLPRCTANVYKSTRKAAPSGSQKLVPRRKPSTEIFPKPPRICNKGLSWGGRGWVRRITG